MSSLVTPADANASADDSSIRSSALLFQCSPKGVHPIPTIATRSLMPFELMCALFSLRPYGPGLPEVVVDLVRGEQAAERHLDAVAHLHARGVDVAELDREPAATVPVDDREDGRRAGGVRDAVDGDERDRADDVGHR